MIEHDLGIMTSHGQLTREQLKGLNASDRMRRGKPTAQPVKEKCPFTRQECSDKCALYDAGTCCIISGGQIDPAGACPFADNDQRTTTHTCESCALYTNNACAFILKGQRKRG